MEYLSYLISFECKNCGWDWMSMFAYCPNCKKSEVKIVDYETVEEFAEKMILLREREMEDVLFVLEEYDWNDK